MKLYAGVPWERICELVAAAGVSPQCIAYRLQRGLVGPDLVVPSQRSRGAAERFWSRVSRGTGCWVWTGARRASGYGVVQWNGSPQYAHRVAWSLTQGTIPPRMFVCHICDNRLCARPDHLFLGTPADNAADAAAKGRMPRGEGHPRARLTEVAVREIRRLAADGMPYLEIARVTGYPSAAVAHAFYRRTWRHVA